MCVGLSALAAPATITGLPLYGCCGRLPYLSTSSMHSIFDRFQTHLPPGILRLPSLGRFGGGLERLPMEPLAAGLGLDLTSVAARSPGLGVPPPSMFLCPSPHYAVTATSPLASAPANMALGCDEANRLTKSSSIAELRLKARQYAAMLDMNWQTLVVCLSTFRGLPLVAPFPKSTSSCVTFRMNTRIVFEIVLVVKTSQNAQANKYNILFTTDMYANCNSVIVKSIVMCTQNLTFNSIITKSNFFKQTTHQSFSKLTTRCACNLGFIFDEHRITSPIRYSFGLCCSHIREFLSATTYYIHNHIYVHVEPTPDLLLPLLDHLPSVSSSLQVTNRRQPLF